MKLKVLSAALLAVSSLSAGAVTSTFGPHDAFEFGFGSAIGSGSSIMDTYSFTLGTTSSLLTTAVTNDLGALDLTGAAIFLYKGTVGFGSFVSGFAFDDMQMASSITPLLAGAYYYSVMGTVASGAVAGSYTFTSQVTAVPEPETYALMLAGLGVMGFVATRRRNRG